MSNKSGINEWKIQRITAIYLAFYSTFLVVYCLTNEINFESWQALFTGITMQIATLIAIIGIASHAWIGLTIVLTDYVKLLWVRYVLQLAILLSLIGYVVWGIIILWGY